MAVKQISMEKLYKKKYKLLDDIGHSSIEVLIEIDYNRNNELQRKIVISKLRDDSNEVTHTYEFFYEYSKDMYIISKHLVNLKAGSNTLRCLTWLTNKLRIKME